MRSLPPSRTAPAWGCRSADPSSRRMAVNCGPLPTRGGARRSSSLCPARSSALMTLQLAESSRLLNTSNLELKCSCDSAFVAIVVPVGARRDRVPERAVVRQRPQIHHQYLVGKRVAQADGEEHVRDGVEVEPEEAADR